MTLKSVSSLRQYGHKAYVIMAKTFFTADLHFGDERMKLFPRPFDHAMQCANTIIGNWNKVVGDDDMVYVVGDFAVDKDWLKIAADLKGEKILLKGNYDTLPYDEYLKYFSHVLDCMTLNLNNPDNEEHLQVNIQHYPGKSLKEYFNIVGHIHGAWRVQKNMLNVGVDVWHYSPVTVEEVFFMFGGIRNFYDQDVWVGDHPANTAHAGRGKEGTYWQRGFVGSRTDSGEKEKVT